MSSGANKFDPVAQPDFDGWPTSEGVLWPRVAGTNIVVNLAPPWTRDAEGRALPIYSRTYRVPASELVKGKEPAIAEWVPTLPAFLDSIAAMQPRAYVEAAMSHDPDTGDLLVTLRVPCGKCGINGFVFDVATETTRPATQAPPA